MYETYDVWDIWCMRHTYQRPINYLRKYSCKCVTCMNAQALNRMYLHTHAYQHEQQSLLRLPCWNLAPESMWYSLNSLQQTLVLIHDLTLRRPSVLHTMGFVNVLPNTTGDDLLMLQWKTAHPQFSVPLYCRRGRTLDDVLSWILMQQRWRVREWLRVQGVWVSMRSPSAPWLILLCQWCEMDIQLKGLFV